MNKNDEDRRNIFVCYSQSDETAVSKILTKALSKKEFYYNLCRSENTDNKKYQLTDSVIYSMCQAQIYLLFISEHSAQAAWLRQNMEVIKEERLKNNETPKIFLIYLDNSVLPDSVMEFTCFADSQQISSDPEIIKRRIIEEFIGKEVN